MQLSANNNDRMRKIEIKKSGKFFKHTDSRELEPSLLFTLDPEWREMFSKWREIELSCERCGIFYNDIENIGAWKCKQHALPYNRNRKGNFFDKGHWDCCGEREPGREYGIPNGCVPCDHRPIDVKYEKILNDVAIPNPLISYLIGFKQEAISKEDDAMEFFEARNRFFDPDFWTIVHRFDVDADRIRKLYGKSNEDKFEIGNTWRFKRDISFYGTY